MYIHVNMLWEQGMYNLHAIWRLSTVECDTNRMVMGVTAVRTVILSRDYVIKLSCTCDKVHNTVQYSNTGRDTHTKRSRIMTITL